MKTLVRIGLILAASLVVIGGAFAYMQYGGNTLLAAGSGSSELVEGGPRPERGQDGEFAGEAPQDSGGERGARREGGHEAGGLGGLTAVLKNLGVIAVITLIVAGIGTAWRFRSSKLRRPTPTVTPPAQPTA